jgi:uncharacterized membrane protein
VPLSLSIAFQRFPDLKRYTAAAVIITAVISFVLEPLLALGGLYELVNWQYVYSFFVYLLIAFGIRFAAKKLLEIENKSRRLDQNKKERAEDEHH